MTIKDKLNQLKEIPQPGIDWEKYGYLIKVMNIPAKTILLHEGDVSKNGHFIKEGCLRLWFEKIK